MIDVLKNHIPDLPGSGRKSVKEALHWRLFKDNQIEALVLNNKKKRLTIKERAQYCAKTGDVWDIYLHALDLAMPKNNTDEAIVASSSRISQFCRELTEAGVGSEQIDIYAKLPEVTRASNEIPKRQLEQRLPYPPKTLKHFSLEEELRIIQNINTTKIPTIQDLADVIMTLSIRPAEVATLHIIYYEPGKSNPPE
ncbi:hypothetical protein C2G38_2035143 [Gigaspora rosea]|uniref:Uncharacterized protein n=1 Tax=Gigaspora rosea TaxID=44941 RepID=A0A397VDR2_9GLOM|nr:hypothetical protein C2G38_2035143 [Gigaspora rosea]